MLCRWTAYPTIKGGVKKLAALRRKHLIFVTNEVRQSAYVVVILMLTLLFGLLCIMRGGRDRAVREISLKMAGAIFGTNASLLPKHQSAFRQLERVVYITSYSQ